jgi:hypothetical protein
VKISRRARGVHAFLNLPLGWLLNLLAFWGNGRWHLECLLFSVKANLQAETGPTSAEAESGICGLFWKNIRQSALQPLHDLMKISQGDALATLFQAMQSRGRQADFSGKFRKSHVAALFAEKRGELFFEDIMHIRNACENPFRLWNNFVDAAFQT